MSNLAIYVENRQQLNKVGFVTSIPEQMKIREITDNHELSKQIGHWITAVTNSLGIANEVPTHNKLDITEMLLSKFKGLSVDELYYAFKMERYGNLGEPTGHYQLFNALYVSQVLTKYINWKQKVRLDYNLPIGKVQEKQELPGETKKELIFNGVMEAYDYYRGHYVIMTGKGYLHELLVELDLITMELDLDEAKEVILIDTKFKKASSLKEKREFNDILRDIQNPGSGLVMVEAKKIAVGKYFRSVERGEFINILKTKL